MDPSARIAAERLVVERAQLASDRLATLARALEPALELARRGSARTVTGDEPPEPPLEEAAALVGGLRDEALAAQDAVASLEGARRAAGLAGRLEPPAIAAALPSIASQLSESAVSAAEFARMRRRTDTLLAAMDGALRAVGAGDHQSAADLVASARRGHGALAAWDIELATLPLWIETTDAMIAAMETMIEASLAGDARAAADAARRYAAAAEDGPTADRALRIALDEGGSAITAAPLSRLAETLRSVEASRREVDDLVRRVST